MTVLNEDVKVCPYCNQKIEKKINRDDVRRAITAFKIVSGYDKDDKSWDKMYYSRYAREAKDLISFLGTWQKAVVCIQDIYEKFSDLGLTVTFNTITKHAAEWHKDNKEIQAKNEY